MSSHNSDDKEETKAETLELFAQQAFELADDDNSGSITVDELTTVVYKIAENLEITPPSQEGIQSLLDEYDDNGDGVLQYEEFRNFVQELFSGESQDNVNDPSNNRRRSMFMNQVKERKISLSDNKFIELLTVQKRQSKMSVQLDSMQFQIEKDIKQSIVESDKKNSVGMQQIQEWQKQYPQKKMSALEFNNQKIQDCRFLKEAEFSHTSHVKCISMAMEPTKLTETQLDELRQKEIAKQKAKLSESIEKEQTPKAKNHGYPEDVEFGDVEQPRTQKKKPTKKLNKEDQELEDQIKQFRSKKEAATRTAIKKLSMNSTTSNGSKEGTPKNSNNTSNKPLITSSYKKNSVKV